MSNDTHDQLRKLLQMKRLETPGKPYFDGFLEEFHRYQRVALIERPTWRTRLAAWWEGVSAPKLAWTGGLAGAFALALVFGGAVLSGGSSMPLSEGGLKMAGAASVNALASKMSGYHFVSSAPARDLATPELSPATASAFDQDFKAARFVTGERQPGYDDTLSF
jgi:hypothetical protein